MTFRLRLPAALIATSLAAPAAHAAAAGAAPSAAPVAKMADAKVADAVWREAAHADAVEVLILLRAVPVATPPPMPGGPRALRVGRVYDAAARAARTAQSGLVARLQREGIRHRAFRSLPIVHAFVPPAELATLAARADVVSIAANPKLRVLDRALAGGRIAARHAKAAESGVAAIRAPELWAQGVRGAGVVIAGADTGYTSQHRALQGAYRGYLPGLLGHHYNWYDAVHEPLLSDGGNPCGYSATEPCDDDGHGTHTMGTLVGLDGGNQIGVAPQAKWIGCRNMDRGTGTPASYLECFDFFLAPTDLSGNNPRPELAPDVVNNSWLCAGAEGCDPVHAQMLNAALSNLTAAGIVMVVAAGNFGPSCGTISLAPATSPDAITVAAGDDSGTAQNFSSRGYLGPGGRAAKPDLIAPGYQVRSAAGIDGYARLNGTSMAAPHVAGAAALLMSAEPALIGDVVAVRRALLSSASPRPSSQCTADGQPAVPNAVSGHGFVDVVAALAEARIERLFRDGFE